MKQKVWRGDKKGDWGEPFKARTLRTFARDHSPFSPFIEQRPLLEKETDLKV